MGRNKCSGFAILLFRYNAIRVLDLFFFLLSFGITVIDVLYNIYIERGMKFVWGGENEREVLVLLLFFFCFLYYIYNAKCFFLFVCLQAGSHLYKYSYRLVY